MGTRVSEMGWCHRAALRSVLCYSLAARHVAVAAANAALQRGCVELERVLVDCDRDWWRRRGLPTPQARSRRGSRLFPARRLLAAQHLHPPLILLHLRDSKRLILQYRRHEVLGSFMGCSCTPPHWRRPSPPSPSRRHGTISPSSPASTQLV